MAELGDAWDTEIAALNKRARVYLRVNTLRGSRDRAVEWLAGHNVEAEVVPGLPDALVLAPGKVLPKPLRLDGRVEIQDVAGQVLQTLEFQLRN